MMKRMMPLIAVAAMTVSGLVECALPPLYESIREFAQLLNVPDLSTHMGPEEAITEVTRTDNGFTIKTTKQTIDVQIVYEPTGLAGPAQFHFVFPAKEPSH